MKQDQEWVELLEWVREHGGPVEALATLKEQAANDDGA